MSDIRVLVTDGRYRNGLATVRSLGKRGVDVDISASTRFATTFFSKYPTNRVVYPSPESNPERFKRTIERHLSNTDIDVFLPAGHYTTYAASKFKRSFEQHAIVAAPEFEIFRRAWDKRRTIVAAREAGIPHPRTVFGSSVSEVFELSDDLDFPLVVKPRSESGSRGVEFVSTEDDLASAFERRLDSDGEPPIVQERIPQDGSGIGAAFLFDEENEVVAEFAYRRLREYPLSGGPSTLRESIEGKEVRRYGRRLLSEMNWRGIAMVEFKMDPRDDTPKLMEVNPRFWGSLHLPLYAGVDFPWLTLQLALGEDVGPVFDYEVGIQCRFMLPGDLLYLFAKHDRDSFREFFPLNQERMYYDIIDRSDWGPILGRVVSMARFSVSPSMWKKVIFR